MTSSPHALAVAVLAIAGCVQRGERGFTAGDSMIPTLAIDQVVTVAPVAGSPPRGSVIVFRAPQQPDRRYVKRVVAIAGDTIAARGDELVVNGTPIARCRIGAWGYGAQRGELWLEAIDGAAWLVFHDAAVRWPAPAGPWTVAPGEVFVVGDNREHARDSRFWGDRTGVPLALVVGVAAPAPPVLPAGAAALQPALDRCLTARGA